MPTKDEVRLVVPAMPEFLRLARVTAAGLASRLGFTYDEVEDLRLAIDELCFGLTGNDGRPGTVEVCYFLEESSLMVQGTLQGSAAVDTPPVLSGLSELILAALVDEHRFEDSPAGPRFLLLKRRRGGGRPTVP